MIRDARPEDTWAADCIAGALPGTRVEQHDDGSLPGMHDLDLYRADVRFGACEVTSIADPGSLALWRGLNGRGEVWEEPGLTGCWWVHVGPDCRFNRLRAELPAFLADLEQRGIDRPGSLNTDPETPTGFTTLVVKVRGVASHLEDYPGVPAVAAQALFIADIQNDEWWLDLKLAWLEDLRLRLRPLIPFILKAKQAVLYTDFTDVIGVGTEIDLSGVVDSFEKFRRKTRHYLREHLGEAAVAKLHTNRPISLADLEALKSVLVSSGLGTTDDITRAEAEAGGFGLFARSLVGLDRAAAKAALSDFLDATRFSADQIHFIDVVVDHLVDHGLIETRRFYESPFTDISPTGPDELFGAEQVDRLLAITEDIRRNAQAA
ncbi:MAG TPA: type I restriction-modification enzyme R subunit C-terminal domain-containing protein [Sporichthyaceae bacterium]|nr:type I restriction-modification enzyme R subunit C-terminal domain-containing protein [Sporichthyaceae bacterium]